MAAIPIALSAPAVASLVSRLEHEPVTTNQVRHLPLAVPRDRRGALRFGLRDVALVRLAVRLTRIYQRERWPLWKARAAVLYLAPIIRAEWFDDDPHALVVNRKDGMAIIVREKGEMPAGIVVPLRSTAVTDDDLRIAAHAA